MVYHLNPHVGSATQVPRVKLTDVGIRSFRPPEKGTVDFWDTSLPSFGCRVSRGGSKAFVLKIHNSRRSIGKWPLISLSAAREEARRLLAEKTLGKVRPQSITVQQAQELFLQEKARARRASTVADLKDRLTRHFNIKGQLSDVTHGEIVRRLNRIGTAAEHNAALRVGKNFWTWCMNRRYITDNPMTGIQRQSTVSRSRVLSDKEIAIIWRCTEEPKIFNSIVRLALLTGQRVGEISKIQTSWINTPSSSQQSSQPTSSRRLVSSSQRSDLCTLTFPAEVTKNGREHTVPLPALAVQLLSPLSKGSGYIFPARKAGPTGCFNGWSKSKAALDKASGVKDWTLHDLRRTYATNMARLGTPPHIIERLLNHISGQISGVSAIYNRHNYIEEARIWVEKYDSWLTDVLRLSGTQIAAQ